MAETLCWHTSGGEPDKDRVRRAKDRLYKKKLIDVARKGWTLTKKRHDAALEARADKHEVETGAKLASGILSKRDG